MVESSPPLGLDLASGDIRTVVWATGYRPDYSWLQVPVLDRKGLIRHDGEWSSIRRACTCWECRSSGGGSRRSSMAPARTPMS